MGTRIEWRNDLTARTPLPLIIFMPVSLMNRKNL
jgi:hypothetical protein